MGTRRPRPQRLPEKLLAIRQALRLSQSQMIRALNVKTTAARLSEYESGTREPNLLMILAYSRVAHVPVEYLIDDDLDLDDAAD